MGNHEKEILQNIENWRKKPVLQEIYKSFHALISLNISPSVSGMIVELGSGIGNIKDVIPQCVRTDMFPHPWLDKVENAYSLSFSNEAVSHIILFDVFHHLKYPGTALSEFYRVLTKKGRLIIFEPCISLLGFLVYGLGHHEPISIAKPIAWKAPKDWVATSNDYYAAAGNAWRVFNRGKYDPFLSDWEIVKKQYLSAFSYVASGGYSKPQFYPNGWLPALKRVDKLLDWFPLLFATRMLVVLEKK